MDVHSQFVQCRSKLFNQINKNKTSEKDIAIFIFEQNAITNEVLQDTELWLTFKYKSTFA